MAIYSRDPNDHRETGEFQNFDAQKYHEHKVLVPVKTMSREEVKSANRAVAWRNFRKALTTGDFSHAWKYFQAWRKLG